MLRHLREARCSTRSGRCGDRDLSRWMRTASRIVRDRRRGTGLTGGCGTGKLLIAVRLLSSAPLGFGLCADLCVSLWLAFDRHSAFTLFGFRSARLRRRLDLPFDSPFAVAAGLAEALAGRVVSNGCLRSLGTGTGTCVGPTSMPPVRHTSPFVRL